MSISSKESQALKTLRELALGELSTSSSLDIHAQDAFVDGFTPSFRLLPHQSVARLWMKDREMALAKGGILADEMGLGKTVEMIVRIVEGPPSSHHVENAKGGGTLIICPVDLIPQWDAELKKLVPSLSVILHHGTSRDADPAKLKKADIVITSFATAASEYAATSDGQIKIGRSAKQPSRKSVTLKKSALYSVRWWRVVLDEAHNIKNHKTKTAVACCELEANFRWCLTGTPMHNSVEDLYSLLHFLRIGPLNEWKDFHEKVCRPIEAGNSAEAMKLLHAILRTTMLRRRLNHQLNGRPIVQLPARHFEVIKCTFDKAEADFYTALVLRLETAFKNLKQRKVIEKCWAHMQVYILRLRQACNHKQLVFMGRQLDDDLSDALNGAKDDTVPGEDEETVIDPMRLLQLDDKDKVQCDICGDILNETNNNKNICKQCEEVVLMAAESQLDGDNGSAKIREILKILRAIRDRSDGQEKTIIFSQFTNMLDLVEPSLLSEGIGFIRYDGSMKSADRVKALTKLRQDAKIQCILISLKAGGTGLNLTCCNNIILVDIWWNPAVEEQAFGRAHRIGQTKPVFIYKLVVPNTIEDRMIELQKKKEALAGAALNKEEIVKVKLNINELVELFGMRSSA